MSAALLLWAAAQLAVAGPADVRHAIPVSVVSQDGSAVGGLSAASFRATIGGRPLQVLSASAEARPQRVALILDVSRSIDAADPFQWQVAATLVRLLAPANELTVMTVADDLRQWSKPTGDEAALLRALDAAHHAPHGGTALYDSLVAAAGGAGLSPGFGAVCLLSDGVDTSSRARAADVEKRLAEAGVRLFLLKIEGRGTPLPLRSAGGAAESRSPSSWTAFGRSRGTVDSRRMVDAASESALRRVVELSGGAVVDLDRRRDAAPTLGAVTTQICRAYHLDLAVPLPLRKWTEWKLQVEDSPGHRLEHIHLLYPRQLAPTPAGAGDPVTPR